MGRGQGTEFGATGLARRGVETSFDTTDVAPVAGGAAGVPTLDTALVEAIIAQPGPSLDEMRLETPYGPLVIGLTPRGVVRLGSTDEPFVVNRVPLRVGAHLQEDDEGWKIERLFVERADREPFTAGSVSQGARIKVQEQVEAIVVGPLREWTRAHPEAIGAAAERQLAINVSARLERMTSWQEKVRREQADWDGVVAEAWGALAAQRASSFSQPVSEPAALTA